MNICALMCCWRRPDVTRIAFTGLKRLQWYDGFTINPLIVLSPEDPDYRALKDMAHAFGYAVVETENYPFGAKKNYGLKKALEFGFDYLMDIDSDNVCSDALLDDYKELVDEGHKFIGVRKHYMADSITGKYWKFNGYMNDIAWGARLIHRDLLDGDLWPSEKNAGMDTYSQNLIKERHGVEPVSPNPYQVIDIKTKTNIHISLQILDLFEETTPEEVASIIPESEFERIDAIVHGDS